EQGLGVSSRFSATLGVDMLYVAVPVPHPAMAFVRLALPLTDIQHQLRAIWLSALSALAFSVVAALAMAWLSSALLVRRLAWLGARAPPLPGRAEGAPA